MTYDDSRKLNIWSEPMKKTSFWGKDVQTCKTNLSYPANWVNVCLAWLFFQLNRKKGNHETASRFTLWKSDMARILDVWWLEGTQKACDIISHHVPSSWRNKISIPWWWKPFHGGLKGESLTSPMALFLLIERTLVWCDQLWQTRLQTTKIPQRPNSDQFGKYETHPFVKVRGMQVPTLEKWSQHASPKFNVRLPNVTFVSLYAHYLQIYLPKTMGST